MPNLTETTGLTEADFRFFAGLIYERSRIVLRPEKRDMLLGRLTKRLRVLGMASVREYRSFLESADDDTEIGELLNAVTTNLTGFFREAHHFEHLATTALPQLMAARAARNTNRVRLWSSACSSGQEPYSMAMTLRGHVADLHRWDALILATDIDTAMVAAGQTGRYPATQSESVPKRYLGRCAHVVADSLVMDQGTRDLIVFKSLNLLGNWPMRGPFDVIFCRNVVIYFDKNTQAELFDRMAEILAPDGWLYIGHSESLFKVCDRFELVGQTVYRRIR